MIIDLVIVIVLVLFCVRSIKVGVKGELVGAIGFIFALIAALWLYKPVADALAKKIPQFEQLAPYISFLVMVVLLRLLIMAVIKQIPESIKGGSALSLNLLAGAIGFFKGAFFMSVVLLLLSKTDFQSAIDSYAEGSATYPHLKNFAIVIVEFVVNTVPNVESILQKLT